MLPKEEVEDPDSGRACRRLRGILLGVYKSKIKLIYIYIF